METTDYAGIDYGQGTTNIDIKTGIRFGVIHQNDVLQAWCDSSEGYYGEEECFDLEPISFRFSEDGYLTESDSYGDIFVMKSPYYTYAQYCSPCAPGACHLGNPLTTNRSENSRCYCFGHDWFEDGIAPYDVFSVHTHRAIRPE